MKKLVKFLTAPALLLALGLCKQQILFYRRRGGRLGWAAVLLLFLLTAAGRAAYTPAQAQANPTTQVGFILDGSGSILQENWETIKTGLANALRDSSCVPQDGSVEFTLTVFSNTADVEIPPTIIDNANVANTLATTVQGLSYPEASTNIAEGLVDTADAMRGSPNFSADRKQAVNLVTDGDPNETTSVPGGCSAAPDDKRGNTQCAQAYLRSQLQMTDDQDELDSEFIGAQGDISNWLRDNIVYPQPGSNADLATNTFNKGWLLVVPDAAGFAKAVCTKFQQIIDPPTPTEVPPTATSTEVPPTATPTPTPTEVPPTATPAEPCRPTIPSATHWGCASGDVHIKTYDGLAYDFQDTGDFLALQSNDEAVIVQTRLEKREKNDSVSINTAAAFRVGGDKIEFYMKPAQRVLINGKEQSLPFDHLDLPRGGSIDVSGSDDLRAFAIKWPDGSFTAQVNMYSNGSMDVCVAKLQGEWTYAGLYGNLDDDPQNDMQIRPGTASTQSTPITPPASADQLRDFGNSWLVRPEESLFSEKQAATPAQPLTLLVPEPALALPSDQGLLGNLNGKPQNDRQIQGGGQFKALVNLDELNRFSDIWRVPAEKSLFKAAEGANHQAAAAAQPDTTGDIDREKATEICLEARISDPLALRNCIYDVEMTKDPSFVQSAKASEESIKDLSPSANPPILGVEDPTFWAGLPIFYVKQDAQGNANGSSWENAFTNLQAALITATRGSEIWVAAGTYYPDVGSGQTDNERSARFTIPAGVKLYGGFAGTETPLDERDWQKNVTVLSGDIDQNDSSGDKGSNSYHVVYLDGTVNHITNTTVIDGFTITAGQADEKFPHNGGGGLFCNGSNSSECSPLLRNVVFVGNKAILGGAMYNNGEFGNSSPTLTNVIFNGNSARIGGALFNQGGYGNSSPTLTNVIFSGNSAIYYGGALYNQGAFQGNSSPMLTNVTFSGNSAGQSGGALYNQGAARGNSNPTLMNVILWNNGAPKGPSIFNDGNATATIKNSIVEGGIDSIAGTPVEYDDSNSDSDPLFVLSVDPASAPTSDGDLRLQPGSPAINAGDSSAIPADITTDLVRNERIAGGTVDIGAVEFQPQEGGGGGGD